MLRYAIEKRSDRHSDTFTKPTSSLFYTNKSQAAEASCKHSSPCMKSLASFSSDFGGKDPAFDHHEGKLSCEYRCDIACSKYATDVRVPAKQRSAEAIDLYLPSRF